MRTFDGLHPFDGAEGWRAFLAVQFRTVLDNALREAIGQYRGETEQHLRLRPGLWRRRRQDRRSGQHAGAQQGGGQDRQHPPAGSRLDARRPVLSGPRFRLVQVNFEANVQRSITEAKAARADVATRRRSVSRPRSANGVRPSRRHARSARRCVLTATIPAQARIDSIRALPSRLQPLGGSVSTIVGASK